MRLLCGYAAQSMSAKAKSPRQGVQSWTEGSFTQEPFGGSLDESPELIVHAGADDVVIELDVARCDVLSAEGRLRERLVVVKLDIEIFALDRPAVTERVLPAGAHRPTGAGIALLMAGARLSADLKFGHVDFGP